VITPLAAKRVRSMCYQRRARCARQHSPLVVRKHRGTCLSNGEGLDAPAGVVHLAANRLAINRGREL
jgi:hypothetical protein